MAQTKNLADLVNHDNLVNLNVCLTNEFGIVGWRIAKVSYSKCSVGKFKTERPCPMFNFLKVNN